MPDDRCGALCGSQAVCLSLSQVVALTRPHWGRWCWCRQRHVPQAWPCLSAGLDQAGLCDQHDATALSGPSRVHCFITLAASCCIWWWSHCESPSEPGAQHRYIAAVQVRIDGEASGSDGGWKPRLSHSERKHLLEDGRCLCCKEQLEKRHHWNDCLQEPK